MTLSSKSNSGIEDTGRQEHPLQTPPAYTPDTETPSQTPPQKQEPVLATSNSNISDRFQQLSSKAGRHLSKAATTVDREWWPARMEKECNKAARILHSFTQPEPSHCPKSSDPRKFVAKIPPSVIHGCAGLAIFNVLRAGACHSSIAGGSGVVVARRPDGTWSPPSAFFVTSLGAGFMFGLDLYDCVCVLNTQEQVDAFTKPRLSFGAEGSVTVGPLGAGSHVESAMSKTAKPIWSYMKSRGVWVGVQIDGTIVLSRHEANSSFYDERGITASRILREDVAWPMGAKPLFDALRALDSDRPVVPDETAPSTSELEERSVPFQPYRDEPEDRDEREEPPKYDDSKSHEDDDDYAIIDEKTRLADTKY
ncbi:hypothetical protein BGZ63DRAFT_48242 [Mariannaea sp. PMI_226]|nr:hypothetical protein BGZ63DRAFT_48242 [Mariannaea sp. PMI_226]